MAIGLAVMGASASAQDVVVMRRSIAVPKPKATPTPTPTPSAPQGPTCDMKVSSAITSSKSLVLAVKAVGATTALRIAAGRAYCESLPNIRACELNVDNGNVAAWAGTPGGYSVRASGTATYAALCS